MPKEPPGFELVSQLGEEDLLAPNGRYVVGSLAVYAGRASPSIAPHPMPRLHEDSRVVDQIPEIVKPMTRIVS
jgi:hypothetical protein